MNIQSAKFIKGVVGPDDLLDDGKDQIAFIGRSNVGKSSTINALTRQKGLARISSTPGHTQQVNVFLINNKFYLVDLPGYGYMKGSRKHEEEIGKLIGWYLFDSSYKQKKVILIIDAKIGLMNSDLDMIVALEEAGKDFVVVANKIDKIKKSVYAKQLKKIESQSLGRKVIPYSAEKKTGIQALINEMTA